MTIKQQEKIRMALILGTFSTALLSCQNLEFLKELPLDELEALLGKISSISIIGTAFTERVASDYQQLKSLYHDVLESSASLFTSFDVTKSPNAAFALYTYLYRGGYLSYQHQFLGSSDTKDFPRLTGVDVVVGNGVCRAISSMFVDICNSIGMKAGNVLVKVNPYAFHLPKDDFGKLPLENNQQEGPGIPRFVLSMLPFANHVISRVSTSDTYFLDPTNAVPFYPVSGCKYIAGGTTDTFVGLNYLSTLQTSICGQLKVDWVFHHECHQVNPSNAYQNFLDIYRSTYQEIIHNLDILEKFYQQNQELYQDIYQLSNEHRTFIKRMCPILPGK